MEEGVIVTVGMFLANFSHGMAFGFTRMVSDIVARTS